MLTRKQFELLRFIQERLRESGVPPSFDEMKDALDLRSKSGIHRLITALEERGFIRRLAHRARAVEILKLPENMAEQRPPRTVFRPEVIQGDRAKPTDFDQVLGQMGGQMVSASSPDAVSIPMIGRIAAGVPIEAIEHGGTHLGVPSMMLSAAGEHYALEVKGDSMIEAGIFEGDIVVIKRQTTAENGDIIVALIEENEATLKRLRRKGASIALEAANPAYGTRLYRTDQVKIQGRMVGLIRTY